MDPVDKLVLSSKKKYSAELPTAWADIGDMNAPRRVIESTTSLPLSSTPPTPKNSEPIFTNATGRVGNGPLTVTVQLPDVVGETVELNSDGTGVVLPELLLSEPIARGAEEMRYLTDACTAPSKYELEGWILEHS